MRTLIISIILFISICSPARAQIYIDASESLFITAGETVHLEGLTLFPTSHFTLSDISLARNGVATHVPNNPYIQRVYTFNKNSNAFSGTIQIDYLDGELNGIPEANLQLNIHNGTSWLAFTTGAANTSTNFVRSVAMNNILLNELTLANLLTRLPVQDLQFDAVRKGTGVKLSWTTQSEYQTKDFLLQRSNNSKDWLPLGNIAATGSPNHKTSYTFTDPSPLSGNNYYQLVQRDLDGKSSLSAVKWITMDASQTGLVVYPNPVTRGTVTLQLSTSSMINIYNANGLMVYTASMTTGSHIISVARYPKGVYYIKAGKETARMVIQ